MALTLSGDDGVAGVNGSATTPAIQGTDTDTGLTFGTNTVNVVTDGTTRATVDSSGRLGIATTTPGSLDAFGDDLVIGDGSGHRGTTIYSGTGSQGVIYFADGTTGGDVARGKVFYSHSDNYLAFDTDATERMRIDSSGNLRFNSGYGSVATAFGVRAWVQWDASPSNSIKGSANVSSITDSGTGQFTVNFSTAMPDAGYAVASGVSGLNEYEPSTDSITTSSFLFHTYANGYVDNNVNSAIVVR